jgi:hypothetical protein
MPRDQGTNSLWVATSIESQTDKAYLHGLCLKLPSKLADKLMNWTGSYLMIFLYAIDKDGKVRNPEIDWNRFNKEGLTDDQFLNNIEMLSPPTCFFKVGGGG